MGGGIRWNPVVDVPPWSPFNDQAAGTGLQLPVSGASEFILNEAAVAAEAALQRYLSPNEVVEAESEAEDPAELADPAVDVYSCDEFRMYEFKVRRCASGRSHDWIECPYAHPGEKARRRDPRKHHYSGTACPDFWKGCCKRGDACEFAHGVFECWLHPARYRTQPCKDGTACRRRVCFFAHTPEQLRVLPQPQQSPRATESYDGLPLRHHAFDVYFPKGLISSSPSSPPGDSTPPSPSGIGVRRASAANDLLASLRKLQLGKVSSIPSSLAGVLVGPSRSAGVGFRGGFCSLPTTPTRLPAAVGGGSLPNLDGFPGEGETAVERVVSSLALRLKRYESLSKKTGLDRADVEPSTATLPDVGWVSELVK